MLTALLYNSDNLLLGTGRRLVLDRDTYPNIEFITGTVTDVLPDPINPSRFSKVIVRRDSSGAVHEFPAALVAGQTPQLPPPLSYSVQIDSFRLHWPCSCRLEMACTTWIWLFHIVPRRKAAAKPAQDFTRPETALLVHAISHQPRVPRFYSFSGECERREANIHVY